MNELNLITQNNRENSFEASNQMNIPTISSDITQASLPTHDYWSYSPSTDLDYTTETRLITEDQWSNVSQSSARDPYRSVLFWKRTSGNEIFILIFIYYLCC